MKKRVLAFFLCIALCGALFSPCIPTAHAAESIANGTCGENLTWVLDSDGVLTISGTGAMAEYRNIPDVPWNTYRSQITSVSLPDGLTSIGGYAFERCTGLTSVSIPSSVASIGGSAFDGCTGLTSITIPSSVTSIESDTFSGCTGLTGITIPERVTCIGWGAFGGCTGLASITIPSSVTSIEPWAFTGCTSLTSITIPSSVTSLGFGTFSVCSSLTSVTIPSSLTSIEYATFSGCSSLTSVTIPSSITSIGQDVFKDCSSLTGIWVDADNTAYCNDENGVLFNKEKTNLICCPGSFSGAYIIPASVTSIGWDALYGCAGLTSISIPEGVTSIGSGAFTGCTGLTSVSIPESVTSIDSYAFSYCVGLTSIIIPSCVTSIENGVFYNCAGLTSISIPVGVTRIGWEAFCGCTSLTSVTIPSSVTSIGSQAFSDCVDLTSVTISDGVTSIGGRAFSGCANLTNISIPSSVTSIGSQAFSSTGLTSVIIPSSVTSIESGAFADCTGLTGIWVDANNPAYSNNENGVLFNKEKTTLHCCPGGFSGVYVISEDVTTIEESAFSGCTGLTSVIFPETLTEIGYAAFFDCMALTGAYFYGDAPQLSQAFFYYDEKISDRARLPGLTLYYMPGRSGWTSPTYGEEAYPTALWCGEISCPGAQFTDQPDASNWAHKGLDFCIARGLLSGTSDTTVSPNVTMNRAMLVTVLYSLEGKPEVTAENPFTDVENDRWFSKPVIWAAANGIVSGAGNGKFNPFGNVTREQIAVMLRSYARYKSFDTSASVELSNYPDAESTSGWAKDALSWAVAEGLISGAASGGATYLNPKNNATRAQVATILMQFVTKVAED